MTIKSIGKSLCPPIILRLIKIFLKSPSVAAIVINPNHILWEGNYSSWHEAKENSKGYDSQIILESCKSSLLKVKNNEAVYERDSVLFETKEYSLGLLTILEKAALETGKLCVLDFGGSLGSSYYQNKDILSNVKDLKWCIVEQRHFVDCGKKDFGDNCLQFYSSLEECVLNSTPNVLLLSSVLQYLPKPFESIEKFISLGILYIVVDRTAFIAQNDDLLTVQNVPEAIYTASYPAWFFNEEKFLEKFKQQYSLLFIQNDFTNSRIQLAGSTGEWKIAAFKKKQND